MIDVESVVFDKCAKAFDAKFPKGSRYGEPTETPAKFPCFTLWEADNSTYTESRDGNSEHHSTVMYELNVYSNKVSGGKQECKGIIELLDKEMLKFGFVRMFCHQMRNQDTRIYRMTARYRGVVGEDYVIYRR